MSVLDSILAQAGEAPMLSGLDYSIVPSSSSVVDRKQCVCAYTTSQTSVTPTDRNVTIRLGTDHFIDSTSIRLGWANVRLLSQGTLIEELPLYGRHHELFGFQLLPFQEQWSESAVCGLHGSWDTANGLMYKGQPSLGKIEPGERAAVLHKLHLSVFNSGKILPARFMPLEVQLFLASNDEWLNTTSTYSQFFCVGKHPHHLRPSGGRRRRRKFAIFKSPSQSDLESSVPQSLHFYTSHWRRSPC